MSRYEVSRKTDETEARLTIGSTPLTIGRSPTSDMVLTEETVSWHHAHLWVEGDQVWVRDLNSRNGTYINDERIRAAQPVEATQTLRIGRELTLQITSGQPTEARHISWLLEDLQDALRFPIRGERLHLGSAPDADVRIPDAPARAATVMVHADGALQLGQSSELRALAEGEVFRIQERDYRIVRATDAHAPTVEWSTRAPYAYTAEVTSQGPSGTQARLTDPHSGSELLLTGNRGILLYVLTSKLIEDRAAAMSPASEGWCNDQDVLRAIWGRNATDTNTLHVLVYRLRKAAEKAGFDSWFIEKRQWGLRVRLADAKSLDA